MNNENILHLRKSSTTVELMEGKLVSSKPTTVSIDDSEEVVRLIRELPPSHCVLKVDSFSLLCNALSGSIVQYFQSTEFTSGGYTWVMHIYPNGDNEDGKDYISIYLSMVDKLHPSSSVNAVLRFFIYDQIRDNYLTVQCIREKRFYAMKTSWGITKFLPVASLTDPSNGFLVNDSCVFGAEVLVLDGAHIQTPTLSMIHCDRSYTWRIDKFSELESVDSSYSPPFTFGQWSWKLRVCPRGDNEKKENSLSLYLELQNGDALTEGSKLYAQYSLSVKHQTGGTDYIHSGCASWFCSKSIAWGYSDFMPLSDLTNSSNYYLVNDVVIIEVHINHMFLLKVSKIGRSKESYLNHLETYRV